MLQKVSALSLRNLPAGRGRRLSRKPSSAFCSWRVRSLAENVGDDGKLPTKTIGRDMADFEGEEERSDVLRKLAEEMFLVKSSGQFEVDYLGESTKGDLNIRRDFMDAVGKLNPLSWHGICFWKTIWFLLFVNLFASLENAIVANIGGVSCLHS